MKVFLKMKGWQLFSVIMIANLMPIVATIIYPNPGQGHFAKWLFNFLFFFIFMLWLWTMGKNLNKKISEDIRPKLTIFKVCMIYSSVYCLVALSFFMVFMPNQLTYTSSQTMPMFFLFIFPMHIFAMVCMFYILYFNAKNLVMAEKENRVKFDEIVNSFVLLWIYFIGIWFVQPRINRIFK